MRKSLLHVGQTVLWGNILHPVTVIEVLDDGVVVSFTDHPVFVGNYMVPPRDIHDPSNAGPHVWRNISRPTPV